jgi:hypothetical protein
VGQENHECYKHSLIFFSIRNELHQFVVVAPTGNAAALLGGSTYYYLFGINEYSGNFNLS